MQQIEQCARASVSRGCGFATLAIFTTMVGLSYHPLTAVKGGAILVTLLTAVLAFKGFQATTFDYRRTELWIMLGKPKNFPPQQAQQVLGRVLRDTYLTFALGSAAVALFMWVVAVAVHLFHRTGGFHPAG